jgi:ribonuclease Z
MAKLIFLGSSSAVAFEEHGNSFLVVQGDRSSILIDCSANARLRLKRVGINQEDISDLFITHFHPDHVSGLATFLMEMWILGRRNELTIHGSDHSLTRVHQMMDLFDWKEWENMYPVDFHTVPLEEYADVLENGEFKIITSPVLHMIPTLGLRIEYPQGDFVVTYSSDTNPIPQTVKLAAGADVLIHEAAGDFPGHSTAAQAGEIASRSGVDQLFLIHYSFYGGQTAASLLEMAKKTFSGEVFLAEDFLEIEMKGS